MTISSHVAAYEWVASLRIASTACEEMGGNLTFKGNGMYGSDNTGVNLPTCTRMDTRRAGEE